MCPGLGVRVKVSQRQSGPSVQWKRSVGRAQFSSARVAQWQSGPRVQRRQMEEAGVSVVGFLWPNHSQNVGVT